MWFVPNKWLVKFMAKNISDLFINAHSCSALISRRLGNLFRTLTSPTARGQPWTEFVLPAFQKEVIARSLRGETDAGSMGAQPTHRDKRVRQNASVFPGFLMFEFFFLKTAWIHSKRLRRTARLFHDIFYETTGRMAQSLGKEITGFKITGS